MAPRHLTFILLVASTLASAPRANAQAADSGGVTLQMPDSIGLFVMTERRTLPDPMDGMFIRFRRSDGLGADLFLYPGPDFSDDCDLSCARELLKREGDQFIGAFPELVRRKYLDTIGTVRDSALVPPARATWRIGRHVWFETRVGGSPRWSDMYLYYQPRLRIKVRATYAADSAQHSEIAEFARAAMDAVANGSAMARAGPLHRLRSMSSRFLGAPRELVGSVVGVLLKMGYVIEDSSQTPLLIVTAPRFAWPEGSEAEPWHGAVSPGVRLVVALRAEGDSTHIEATARSPLRPGWTDPPSAEKLQLITVAAFMTSLSEATRTGVRTTRPGRESF